MVSVYDELKLVVKSDQSKVDKALTAFDKVTPGSEEDTRNTRSKIETYLRGLDKEGVNPDQLKHDLEALIAEPKSSKEIIRNRINQIDRSTIVTAIAHGGKVSDDKAEKIVGYVEQAISYVKNKVSGSGDGDSKRGTKSDGSYQDQAFSYQNPGGFDYAQNQSTKVDEFNQPNPDSGNVGDNKTNGTKSKFEDKLKNYFDSMERPEFNYDRMKMDFEHILHDPKATFSILKNRFSEYDKESLITLLSSNSRI